MNCTYPGCNKPSWSNRKTCYRHSAPPEATIRRVWVAVCKRPHASVREITSKLSSSTSTVNRALHELRRRGAIERDEHKSRTVTITAARCGDHAYRAVWMDLGD